MKLASLLFMALVSTIAFLSEGPTTIRRSEVTRTTWRSLTRSIRARTTLRRLFTREHFWQVGTPMVAGGVGGETTTLSIPDSLPSTINQARIVREYGSVMTRLVDRVNLGRGLGNKWNEISLAKLTASAITETTNEENPQQLSDTLLQIEPSMISVHTILTDKVQRNVSQNVIARTGALGQNAIERKKDLDGIAIFKAASSSVSAAGSTLTSGNIAAAASNIRGNTTEPWDGPVAFVLHSFQNKDLYDELVGGIGTNPTPAGPSATVFSNDYSLPIANATAHVDDNIVIDSGADADSGGVFASGKGGGIILVQSRAPKMTTVRNEAYGGGADEVFHRDEYAYGERSSGNWTYRVISDATAPTA